MSEDYSNALYLKLKSEHRQFLTELSEKTANDIILSAYEIVTKNEILMFCENENPDLTDEQFKFLLSRPAILDDVFEHWCSNGELTSYDEVEIVLKDLALLSN